MWLVFLHVARCVILFADLSIALFSLTVFFSIECHAPTSSTGYDVAANDVWSLGVILINLTCGRNPWKTANRETDESFKAFLNSPYYLQRILPITAELNEILARMFDINPQTRITLAELYESILHCPRFTVSNEEYTARVNYYQRSAAEKSAHPRSPPVTPPRRLVNHYNGTVTPVTPSMPFFESQQQPQQNVNNPFRNRMAFVYATPDSDTPFEVKIPQIQPPVPPHRGHRRQQQQSHHQQQYNGLGISGGALGASERLQQVIWSSDSGYNAPSTPTRGRPISSTSTASIGSSWASPQSTPATSVASSPRSDTSPLFLEKIDCSKAAEFPSSFDESVFDADYNPYSRHSSPSPTRRLRKFSMAKMLPKAGNVARQRRGRGGQMEQHFADNVVVEDDVEDVFGGEGRQLQQSLPIF